MPFTHLEEDTKLLPQSCYVYSVPKAGDTLSQRWGWGMDPAAGRVKFEPETVQIAATFPKGLPELYGTHQFHNLDTNKGVRREERKSHTLVNFMLQTPEEVLQSTFITNNNLFSIWISFHFRCSLMNVSPRYHKTEGAFSCPRFSP